MYFGHITPFHASYRKLWALRCIKSASQLVKRSSLLMPEPSSLLRHRRYHIKK